MQAKSSSSILQTEDSQWQESATPDVGRSEVQRVPSNHRQAERKLIIRVEDGTFEIDDKGRVWRLRKRIGCRWHGTKTIDVSRQRAEHRTPPGYLQVCAVIEGKRHYALAHRLVWHYFYGFIPDGMCMNHKNGIKDDNRPENLEIMTYSENMSHAHRNRLLDQRGERNPAAKLSNQQVQKMRELYATGKYLQQELAKRFDISLIRIKM